MTIAMISARRPSLPPTPASERRSAETGMPAGQVEHILQDTWGHMRAEANRTYEGFILFTHSCYRQITILDWKFEDLSGGPWFPEHMMEFVCGKVPQDATEFRLWRFDGTYRELKNGKGKFTGKVRPMRVQHRFPGSGRKAA